MISGRCVFAVSFWLCVVTDIQGQVVEPFCFPASDADCTDDTLAIVFPDSGASVLSLPTLDPGEDIFCDVVIDAKTAGIQSWSFAVVHDTRYLRLVEVTTEGTIVDPEHPDTVMDGGNAVVKKVPAWPHAVPPMPEGWISSVQLSPLNRSFLPQQQQNVVARARYEVIASLDSAGTWIKLVHEKVGVFSTERSPISIVTEGNARRPETLRHGWIQTQGWCSTTSRVFCEGGDLCIPDSIEVFFPRSQSSMLTDTKPGDMIDAEVFFETQRQPTQGWEYAVAHDKSVLDLVEVTTEGTMADPDHPDSPAVRPNFDVTTEVPGGFISAIILSFTTPVTLPIGRNRVSRARYTQTAGLPVGGTRLRLVHDEIGPEGTPRTHIKIWLDGEEKRPTTLRDGLILHWAEDCNKNNLPDVCDIADGTSRDANANGIPDECEPVYRLVQTSPGLVQLVLANTFPVKGGQIRVSYNPDVMLLESVDRGPDFPPGNGQVEYQGDPSSTDCPSSPQSEDFVAGWINSLDQDIVLPIGTHRILELRFSPASLSQIGDCSPLRFVECSGELSAGSVVIDQNNTTRPGKGEDGSFCVLPALFRRGDANPVPDGLVDISDPIAILTCLFLDRSACNPCDDARDSDDDGVANLTDAILILNWLFRTGPAPAEPFRECGKDLTEDTLTCKSYSGC